MSARSQAWRSPFQCEQSSLSPLDGLENIFPQRSTLVGNGSTLTPDHLNRPLPPIPSASRKSSSVYSLEHEDILDYYTDKRSKDGDLSSYDVLPVTVSWTSRNLYSETGSSSQSTTLTDQLSPILSDPAGEIIDTPSWISQKSRSQYTSDHYGQPILPSFKPGSLGAGSVAQSFDVAFTAVSAKYSDRPVSPKSQPKQRRSPSRNLSPLTSQTGSTRLLYSESSSVSSSVRPVSLKSIPRSSRAAQTSQTHQGKPPLASQEYLFDSVSPSSSMQSGQLISTLPIEQQSSTPPPISPNNRVAPPSSWAYLHNRLSDMHDTLANLTISPDQRVTSVSKDVGSPGATHFRDCSKNSSSNPLNLSLKSRQNLKRPASFSSNTPRPVLRSPAVPITPYQYMGTKAWEERGSPKSKSKERPKTGPHKKSTSPLHIKRFASLVGKGKKGSKEEKRAEKSREELKKTIVVLGPRGDETGGGIMGQVARTTPQGMDWV